MQIVHVTNAAVAGEAAGAHCLTIKKHGQKKALECTLCTLNKDSHPQHNFDFIIDETVEFRCVQVFGWLMALGKTCVSTLRNPTPCLRHPHRNTGTGPIHLAGEECYGLGPPPSTTRRASHLVPGALLSLHGDAKRLFCPNPMVDHV